MNETIWHYIEIIILFLSVIGIFCYYCHTTVKIYNFCERNYYQYLGYLRICKKRGKWYLRIPKKIIEDSLTTEYEIICKKRFGELRKGEKVHINFADGYQIEVRLAKKITIKNYIATSGQL